MSTIDLDDLEAMGYFLPEDSQLRLKKLREYVAFLANLARPRTSDEEQGWTTQIRVGEVATCMELLEEQIGQVLDELSWPARLGEGAVARRENAESIDAEDETEELKAMEADDVESEAAAEEGDSPGKPYAFGVTLDQIDEIDQLLGMIRAHGDVVVANDEAEFAAHTLSTLGYAIFCNAEKLREIIRDVNLQRLGLVRSTRNGVREESAVYCALLAHLPMGSTSHIMRQLPTYQ